MEPISLIDNIDALLNLSLIDRAWQIALDAHGGDRNKHDGELYLLHPHRVAILVREAGGDEVLQAIALMHDVVEDTVWTLSDIVRAFPDEPRIPAAIDGLTKREGETKEETLLRCKKNSDSCFVKLRGDIVDNFRRNHLIRDPEKKARLAHKASLGFSILTD